MLQDKQIHLSEYIPKSQLVVKKNLTDTPRYPVIDIHGHFGRNLLDGSCDNCRKINEAVEHMKRYGLRNTVNLDGSSGEKLDLILKNTHPYEDFMLTFASIDVTRIDDADFEHYVKSTLKEAKSKGVKGIKSWKALGLVWKDKSGKYIRPDDSRLKVLWETASELDLPVLIHIADPIAFFTPVDRFNERFEELLQYPDWSFYGPGFYSFDALMKMQENLLEQNPKTTFILAHVGSCSENLSYVSESLDRFPNMYIDISARISELGRQPYTSKKFFTKYQDRILFGTDAGPFWEDYPVYYRFLETSDEYFDYSYSEIPAQGRWKIYGIGLEDDILKKIYCGNALKLLKL